MFRIVLKSSSCLWINPAHLLNPWFFIMGRSATRRHVTFLSWLSGRMAWVPDRPTGSVVPIHLPPDSRADTFEESENWVSFSGVMMGDVTGGDT